MQRNKVLKLKVEMCKVMTSGLKDEGLGDVMKNLSTVERRRGTSNHARG